MKVARASTKGPGTSTAANARSVFLKIKSTTTLPSPTGTAMEVLRMVENESATLDQLAALVETDPALASRIMKFVNSPLAGLSRQIASVPRAVCLLGMQAVKNISLGLSVMNQHPAHCEGFDHDDFCSESVARALPRGAVLVDFAQIQPFDFQATGKESRWGPAHYLAFVLPAGDPEHVALLDLGDAEPIDGAVAELKAAIEDQQDLAGEKAVAAGEKLYAMVFAKLEKEFGEIGRAHV